MHYLVKHPKDDSYLYCHQTPGRHVLWVTDKRLTRKFDTAAAAKRFAVLNEVKHRIVKVV
jgi:hypothetical protein